MAQSKIHFSISGRNAKALENYPINTMDDVKALEKLGIHLTNDFIGAAHKQAVAMDSMSDLTATTASVGTPVQFLQAWLPGFVNKITRARKADELVGITTIGKWQDEEVVQGISERTGSPQPYLDDTNIPRASWNVNFAKRTVVRFEEGLRVGKLEEARASEMNLNSAATKREAAALSLEIERNYIAFYGYNAGNNLTYGLLNDPNLPAYSTFANGSGGSATWSSKTAQEIFQDIQAMVAALRNQSGDLVDAAKDPTTLVVATAVRTYLDTPYNYTGITVYDQIRKTYPAMRIESAPEFNSANGGANACYLYADEYSADSTDDGKTIIQMIPTKFMTVGAMPTVKGFEEDYTNATAGILCKRPWAVVRRSGN